MAMLGSIKSMAEAAIGGLLLGAQAVSIGLRGLLDRSDSTKGRGLLILDSSYSLHEVQDRGLEWAVLNRDLDGYFDHVWTCHPLVGAADEHPEPTGVGDVGSTPLSDRHTFLEGRIARSRLLEDFEILNFALAQADLLSELDGLIRDNDVSAVRAGDPHYKGLLGWLLARSHDLGFVIRVGENYDASYELTGAPANPRLIGSRRIEKLLERFLFHQADLVLGANEDNLEFAVENGADRDRTALVRYGNLLNPVHFQDPDERDDASEDLAELGLQDRPFLVNVGRLEPVKHVTDLLDVAEILAQRRPEAAVLLVGDGTLREALEQEARDRGVREQVVFAGYRSQEWIARVLPNAKAAVSPHMGRALVETALAGVPPVAYERDWQSEFVDQDRTGILVPFGDAKTMAEEALELIETPHRRDELGSRVRKHARSRMDPERVNAKERDAYEQIHQAWETENG